MNLDDDLHEVVNDEGDSASELVFDEFEECLVRLAAERHKSQEKAPDLRMCAQEYAALTQTFLDTELYPAFKKYVKTRAKRNLAATGKMALLLRAK